MFYAHSVEGKPVSQWQGQERFEQFKPLEALELLERFFNRFERLLKAGLWQDVGKNIERLNIKNIGHSLGKVGVYNGTQ